jgi:hypothetical protein
LFLRVSHIVIWIDFSELNWDCGLVNCGTNIPRGCWLFWQNKILFFAGHLSFQNLFTTPLISPPQSVINQFPPPVSSPQCITWLWLVNMFSLTPLSSSLISLPLA